MNFLGFLFFIQRFFMKNSFSMLLPLTSECYPTLYRTMGYGFAAAIGRTGAFVSTFIVFPLFYKQSFLPFLAFGCITFIAAITTAFLKKDTTMAYLD